MQRQIYRNKRNEDKYIEVIHYDDGHYYAVQFMRWGTIVNKLGSRTGRRGRWRKAKLVELLDDYKEIEPFDIRLKHRGNIWQHYTVG